MNIVFYHSSLRRGGAERVIANLANYFAEKNHRVSIIVIDNQEPEYELNKAVQFINLYHIMNSSNLFAAIFNNIKLAQLLNACIKEIRPQLVVCFGHSQLLHAVIARRQLKYKIVGSERTNPYMAVSRRGWEFLKRRLYRRADGFVFQTNGAKEYYTKNKNDKGCIIGNPVSNEFLDRELKCMRERNPKNFCSMGRLMKTKAFDSMILSFYEFHKSYPDTRLFIYGEGKERERLERLILKLHMENAIFLPGKIKDVFDTLNRYRYFLMSSQMEGMPNALIEAMACGCACISTKCKFGPEDLIEHGNSGILVSVGDKKEMVEAMKRLYTDLNLCERLGRNAAEIKAKYGTGQIAELYLDYFQHVLEN